MELYHGFKKEIDEHGNEDQKRGLISIMLETVGHKPSLAMSKYDQADTLEAKSFLDLIKGKTLKALESEDVVLEPPKALKSSTNTMDTSTKK